MTAIRPRITVGIPTFNRAAWLRTSIESVLSQTLTDFRLVISDNASEDDTPEVVRSFADERITYLRSDRNVGAIANLNRLIALAETEFLVLLPDDDLLYPEHLRNCVDLLERSETIGVAHSAYNVIDAEARVLRCVDPFASRSRVTIDSSDQALERLIGSPSWLGFASIMYRTRAIAQVGGFRPEDEPLGDRKLWMRIALNWGFAYTPAPLVAVREHPTSLSWRIAGNDMDVSDDSDMVRFYAEFKYRGRMDFIDEAGFAPGAAARFRALATLEHLIENAALGTTARHEIAAQMASLVRLYPSIVSELAFWHLFAAQAGGRRLRAVLRRAFEQRRRQAMLL